MIDDHRMVDHQINGDQRIDLFGIAAQRRNAVAHRGEVDDRRNAGEVLHEHARGPESDLLLDLSLCFSIHWATPRMSSLVTERPSS